jgi:cell division protein FtsN
MANFERYEPRADSSRVFDGEEPEELDDEGSRLPLLLVIGLLVVAAFAGVVWLAYTQGVQRGRADAPRMLVAANGPVKVAPSNPGGVETPFKGLKIYQQPAPPEDEDADSAPQPPTPKVSAPVTISQAPASLVAGMTVAAPANNKGEGTPVVARTAAAASMKVKAPTGNENAGTPVMAPASAPETQSIANKPPRSLLSTPKSQPASILEPVTKTAASAPVANPPVAPVKSQAANPPPDGGTVALQIGAYKSEDEANAAWRALQRSHPIVGGYQSEVRKVDLADKGVWYRLRLGRFANKSEAAAFCDKLRADGGNCFLAR